MTTIATTHSGFGGVEIGAMAAGLESLYRIEIDPAIAAVADANLPGETIVADILDIDPATLKTPDAAHFSPVCKRASVASRGEESEEDIAHGRWIARYIDHHRPKIITLENVWGYRTFEAFLIIQAALVRNGYFYDFEHLNAADFGVPQTRRRLILRAVRGSLLPPLPAGVGWVGWYGFVIDLLPSLRESRYAPWQIKRSPELSNVSRPIIVDGRNGRNFDRQQGLTIRPGNKPSFTIAAGSRGHYRIGLPDGRVVLANSKVCARIQTFPDWYKIPRGEQLAMTGIGNAVPPLMMQVVYGQLMRLL